tara:strand:- start:473 stop:844 length:372 start_codon:yes stop_codon:yes gene_type:complete
LSSFNNEKKIDCKNDSKRLKINAHQIFPTAKPSMRLSAKRMIKAFMISKKRPKVITVTGNVRITNIGFTSKFSILSTTATMTAVIKLSTDTLGNTFAKMITAIALKRILKISFIGVYFIGIKV